MACVNCNSQSFRFLFEKNSYRIEKCSLCDLVQVTNIPSSDQVEESYDEGFYEEYYKDLESNKRKQRYVYLNFENKLDQIEKRIRRSGKLLDVGCSFGFFLDRARQRGWNVAGIEVSEYAATYARTRLGLSVIDKPIMEAQFAERSFDVITMWYVIEHLPNPREVLQHLGTLLSDDGILVVSTSNVESYLARIQGKRWRIWIPPVHVVYFCPRTIRNLVEKCGLELIDYDTALPYEKYFRKLGLYSWLNKLKISDNIVYYARKAECSHDMLEEQRRSRYASDAGCRPSEENAS
jgi:2-polyprenyl-3-methyl-5-hydroxy-6-metoxy-1,4-benzoquinol methylase